MKVCPDCKEVKSEDEFYKSKKTIDGLYRICKSCKSLDYLKYREKDLLNKKRYREENKEAVAESKKKSVAKKRDHYLQVKRDYYQENKVEILKEMQLYRDNNKEKINERHRLYYLNNSDVYKYNAARRRVLQKRAQPPCLTEDDLSEIKLFYKVTSFLEKITGEKFHVDHIIPINNDIICGLHVPWNLQILTAKDNIRKSNHLYD